MTSLLLVGTGGFVGSVLRFAMSGLAHRVFSAATFPIGTLTVNVLGCLLIGYFNGVAEARQFFGPQVRVFLFIGVLGGFTTFSTFGYETLALLRDSEVLRALLNVIASVVVCLAAVWLGYGLGKA